mmetsp:Transcript_27185/g.60037  ORF Transcript_27185/g.60037 Transcript_27185/m.60037 type:complete len:218 (-) Transcript_27185:28-681(-)
MGQDRRGQSHQRILVVEVAESPNAGKVLRQSVRADNLRRDRRFGPRKPHGYSSRGSAPDGRRTQPKKNRRIDSNNNKNNNDNQQNGNQGCAKRRRSSVTRGMVPGIRTKRFVQVCPCGILGAASRFIRCFKNSSNVVGPRGSRGGCENRPGLSDAQSDSQLEINGNTPVPVCLVSEVVCCVFLLYLLQQITVRPTKSTENDTIRDEQKNIAAVLYLI